MINIIEKYAGTDSRIILNLASADESAQAAALIGAVEEQLLDLVRDVINKPQMDVRDIKNDVRYRLGFIAALDWVVKLPKDARKYIATLEEGE